MTATLTGERAALLARRAELLTQLTAVRAELTRLSDMLYEAHDEFQSSTMSFFRARMHVDSAWRSTVYAVENVENK